MESPSTLSGMCRCCAAEGTFKDIKRSYQWMGEEEVYGDMIRECFDVKLITSEFGGICEMCITHLRNAFNFKKQVLDTEQQFKQHLEAGKFKSPVVKEELSADEDMNDSEDNDMDNIDDEDYVPEFEVPIKTEDLLDEPLKSKKRSAKPTTSRAKKSKSTGIEIKNSSGSDDDDDDTPLKPRGRDIKLIRSVNFNCFISIPPSNETDHETNEKKHTKERKKEEIKTTTAIVAQSNRKIDRRLQNKVAHVHKKNKVKKEETNTKYVSELHWQIDNIRSIIKCTNATPILSKKSDKYVCAYCFSSFDKPSKLKSHTLTSHKHKLKAKFMNVHGNLLSKFIVFLDITDLVCQLCNTGIENLELLMEHLKAHKQNVHTDIKNHIVPLKVVGDEENMCCAVCDEVMDFDDVEDHMGKHYSNYECYMCFLSFVNKARLTDHQKRLHKLL